MILRLAGRHHLRPIAGEAEDVHDAGSVTGKQQHSSRRLFRRLFRKEASARGCGAAAIPAFLAPYGYVASSDVKWGNDAHASPHPLLFVKVSSHAEVDKHTQYRLDCSLMRRGSDTSYLEWSVDRRLRQLRVGLHDAVKKELGSVYHRRFYGAHFAHHGGLGGTTSRLNAWCGRFAACVNMGEVSPKVLARALTVLGAPRYAGMDADGASDSKVISSDASASTTASDGDPDDASLYLSGSEFYESDFESDSDLASDTGSDVSEEYGNEARGLTCKDEVPMPQMMAPAVATGTAIVDTGFDAHHIKLEAHGSQTSAADATAAESSAVSAFAAADASVSAAPPSVAAETARCDDQSSVRHKVALHVLEAAHRDSLDDLLISASRRQ